MKAMNPRPSKHEKHVDAVVSLSSLIPRLDASAPQPRAARAREGYCSMASQGCGAHEQPSPECRGCAVYRRSLDVLSTLGCYAGVTETNDLAHWANTPHKGERS